MPEIKLDKLVSVNSEDEKFKACNLMNSGSGKSWKTDKPVEKAVAIFQFKKSSTINGVTVGNNGSAFLEISVGTEASDDWKVLLHASSLMTPADARSSQNPQKVRMLKEDVLTKPLLTKSWDRVKIVCSQPFNKRVAYGLSFISFLTEDTTKEDESAETKPVASANVSQPDQKTYQKGSLFEQRKRLQSSEPPATAAEAVRALTREVDDKMGTSRPTTSHVKPLTSEKRSSKDDRSHDPPVDKKPKISKHLNDSSSSSGSSKLTSSTDVRSARSFTGETRRRSSADDSNDSAKVPLKEILKGVNFSLSGYKDPMRSDLREKGLAMGAKYSPDTGTCTHLICAFENTPKYDQMDGKRYIVKHGWLLDQHKFQKKLRWREYRLGRAKTPPLDKKKTDNSSTASRSAQPKATQNSPPTATNPDKPKDDVGALKRKAKITNPIYDEPTDEDEPAPKKADSDPDFAPTQPLSDDSDETEVDSVDTEDEIEAHLAGKPSPVKGKAPANGSAPPIKSSDGPPSPGTLSTKPLPKLPNYLEDKVFFLFGKVSLGRTIFRYIYAYGGEVEGYMCDSVKFVITDEKWDDNFDSALNDNPELIFVKSQWILDIHTRQKMLPYQKYAIIPQ